MDENYRLWLKLSVWQRIYFLVLVHLLTRTKRMVAAGGLVTILVFMLLTPHRAAVPLASLAGFYAMLGAMLL